MRSSNREAGGAHVDAFLTHPYAQYTTAKSNALFHFSVGLQHEKMQPNLVDLPASLNFSVIQMWVQPLGK